MQANEIWFDNAPDSTVELSSVLTQKLVTEDVIQTVATDAIGSGTIDYFCIWYPLGVESAVVAA